MALVFTLDTRDREIVSHSYATRLDLWNLIEHPLLPSSNEANTHTHAHTTRRRNNGSIGFLVDSPNKKRLGAGINNSYHIVQIFTLPSTSFSCAVAPSCLFCFHLYLPYSVVPILSSGNLPQQRFPSSPYR